MFYVRKTRNLSKVGTYLNDAQKNIRYTARAFLIDKVRRFRYGSEAPLYAERIWVNPLECKKCIKGLGSCRSGKVVKNTWPPEGGVICELRDNIKIRRV